MGRKLNSRAPLPDLPAEDSRREPHAPEDSAADISRDLHRHFEYTLGRDEFGESRHYLYTALAITIRDRMVGRWRATRERYRRDRVKRVSYLSMEYLMGRTLGNALLNLDIGEEVREALKAWSCALEQLEEEEADAGLGNGGLGRLAACFLDSCATLEIPVTGYGIRYEYGMFRQIIEGGVQVEQPDPWLRHGNPWEIESPDASRRVKFFGRLDKYQDETGELQVRWVDTTDVLAVPWDLPVPGYRNQTVNTLRLWKSEATDRFNLAEFNAGSYTDAVAAKNLAEQITMVLYPSDASEAGKELRLRQQYFLASASLQDVIWRWTRDHGEDFSDFAGKNVFQLNDTHPTVAIAEMMRLLIDDHGLPWDAAWAITTETMAYTNHTLLPEALESWRVSLFGQLLPRLIDIIFEINARFLARVEARWPGDQDRRERMSIISGGDHPMVRMAYLGIVGSFSVNGVSELHSKLLTQTLFRDFFELWPAKFNSKTNGVTPRRWLAHCNRGLGGLVTDTIGAGWTRDLNALEGLNAHAADPAFTSRFLAVRRDNKQRLAHFVQRECGVDFHPEWLFDVQVKRFHEYKRQLLNVLHIIHLHDRILRGDAGPMQPRCVLIGGKAAPGYVMAKRILQLVNHVAEAVNGEPACRDLLRVAFLPDYRVTSMEVICPGTDLSQQISTAGNEASGTGNMKFMMNGAVTIGTLDGANIEILDAVGEDNFFLFGLTAGQVRERRANYQPDSIIAGDSDLARVMQLLESGHFDLAGEGVFRDIIGAIRHPHEPWMTAADFRGYVDAQRRAAAAFADPARWTPMSIANIAASGRFSSDRTIRDYRDGIWYQGR